MMEKKGVGQRAGTMVGSLLMASGASLLGLVLSMPAIVASDIGEPGERFHTRFEEGMAHWKSGDRAAALAAFEASTERTLYYASPVGDGYGSFLELKGIASLQGAREAFGVVLLGPADEAEAHFFVGNVFKFGGLWREAVEEYQEAIRLKPSHAQAQFYLGHEWARLYLWEAAVGPLRAAATLAPSDPASHMLLAVVLGQIVKTSARAEAVHEAQEGVRLLPTSPHAHWILGHAYLSMAQRDEAAAAFRTYIALESKTHDPASDSGIARAKQLLDQMAPYLSP